MGKVKVQCQRCKWIWHYKGKKNHASCPNCKTTVSIRKFKPKKEHFERRKKALRGSKHDREKTNESL